MKRRFFFLVLGLLILLFAVGGWTDRGLRWALTLRWLPAREGAPRPVAAAARFG
jgi:hypothetical protein